MGVFLAMDQKSDGNTKHDVSYLSICLRARIGESGLIANEEKIIYLMRVYKFSTVTRTTRFL